MPGHVPHEIAHWEINWQLIGMGNHFLLGTNWVNQNVTSRYQQLTKLAIGYHLVYLNLKNPEFLNQLKTVPKLETDFLFHILTRSEMWTSLIVLQLRFQF